MHASKQIFRCYPFPHPKEKKGGGGSEWSIKGFEADSEIAAEINRVGAPWAGPMLFLDCETLAGAKDGQGLRFGAAQEHGYRYDWRVDDAAAGVLTRNKLDTLWHEVLFYEPANCTPEGIVTLKLYAAQHELDFYTRAEFVKRILYRNHYVKRGDNWEDRLREPCLVTGHNLPFDLGALAVHCGLAEKDLHGGLSLVMAGGEYDPNGETDAALAARIEAWQSMVDAYGGTDCKELPVGARIEGNIYGPGVIVAIETEAFGTVAQVKFTGGIKKMLMAALLKKPRRRVDFEHRIAIKKLGFGKHLYRGSKQQNGEFIDQFGEYRPRFMEMIHCLDTQTLARSLLGPGPSGMSNLLRRLECPEGVS